MKKDKNIMVSICCTAFNHANYIEDALKGFIEQKVDFLIEAIVHDDASTDGTKEIIEKYAAEYPLLIKPIYQKINMFSNQSYNKFGWGQCILTQFVFPAMSGKYIALCDGDDYWTDPLKLQKQVNFLQSNTDYVMTYHKSNFLLDGGKTTPFCEYGRDFNREDLIAIPSGIANSSKVFRNLYNKKTKQDFINFAGDSTLTCYLGFYGKCKFIEDIKPSMYRVHSGGIWNRKTAEQKILHRQNAYEIIYNFVKRKKIEKYTKIRERSILKYNYYAIIIPFLNKNRTHDLKITLDSIFNQMHKYFRVFLLCEHENIRMLSEFLNEYDKSKIHLESIKDFNLKTAFDYGLMIAEQNGLRYACLLNCGDYWIEEHLNIINKKMKRKKCGLVRLKTIVFKNDEDFFKLLSSKQSIDCYDKCCSILSRSSTCINIRLIPTRLRLIDENNDMDDCENDLWARIDWHLKHFKLKLYDIDKVTCYSREY